MTLSEMDRKRGFNKLSQALQNSKLPCENGPHRWSNVSEFMLMGYNFGRREWQFKHVDSRNYLFVNNDGDLHIPMTDQPFFLGYFDKL